ncbi:MAG: radical SAM protein [Firmicutes bacterium]|nr:radical SAM protein [Bacillota bacterium]
MMFYRLSETVALRGWKDAPFAYYRKGEAYAKPLRFSEYVTLLLCDGHNDLPLNDTIQKLLDFGMIVPCREGEEPSSWSVARKFDNNYMPKMILMITGKCNYNCLHCFNAADNAPLMSEWDFEELCRLLDECADCGVNAVTLTGGEPMAHGRFADILKEIHARGMYVEELNTNGYFITQGVLDLMKSIGCRPLIKISFDGIGYHDWMRSFQGAEERTLKAIRLCVENAFSVKVQTQANRRNVGALLPTARLLAETGVSEMRVIRTTEAPRWEKNAKGASLSVEEYYEEMLRFVREYAASGLDIDLAVWQFADICARNKTYRIVPVMMPCGKYDPMHPACADIRRMLAVSSSGEAVPCLQMSGYFAEHGISFGNLHRKSLREFLNGGALWDTICLTAEDIRMHNGKCASCGYFELCAGGCRALGGLHSGEPLDLAAPDPAKCLFFENGWHRRIAEALEGWTNLTPF